VLKFSLQGIHGLQFNNNRTFHDEVQTIGTIDQFSFVQYRDWLLSLEMDPPFIKFGAKALFIGTFEKSRTELTVNLYRSPDYRLGQLFPGQQSFFLRALRVLCGEYD